MTNRRNNKAAHVSLKDIFDEYPDELLNITSLCGYIGDLYRGERRIKRLLKEAVRENIVQKIWMLNELEVDDRQIKLDTLKLTFREEHFFQPGIAEYIIDSFVYALGWIDELEEFTQEEGENIRYGDFRVQQEEDGLYLGELDEENQRSGFGIYDKSEETLYAGEWKLNYRDGVGIRLDAGRQEKYAGEWRMNRPTGIGVSIRKDGVRYAGEWKNGKLKGTAMCYLPNGCCKIGQMVNGQFSGYGMITLNSGEYIMGEFKENELHGKCRHIYPDGREEEEWWEKGIKVK